MPAQRACMAREPRSSTEKLREALALLEKRSRFSRSPRYVRADMPQPRTSLTVVLLLGASLSWCIGPLPARAERDRVYALQLEVDIPVMAASAILGASYLLRNELAPAHCAPRCPRDDLSLIDRPV